jgi:exodeoxyribonuclease VII small subunit
MKKNKDINSSSYSALFMQLQQLVAAIEDDALPLDLLHSKIEEANKLLKICEQKLRNIETDLEPKTNL